ncbi:MAG: zinc transporter ZntB [Alphaproteobacteria bacterium]
MAGTHEEIDVHALPEDDGLIFGCALDGAGGAELGDWQALEDWRRAEMPHWLHLNAASPRVQAWLRQESGLTPVTVEALLAVENRPRTFYGKRGTIAILRGVNTNPGAEPEDMVALRIWSDGTRVITVRHLRLMTPRDILGQLLNDRLGPANVSELFERLITRLTERMGAMVMGFDERLDTIEASLAQQEPSTMRTKIQEIRQDIVILRRYMAPQREAVATLYAEPPPWFDEQSRLMLRETANRLVQYIEALDAARERAVVLDDGVANRQAERLNQNMYVLSIIAAIFLPLGFITGLLGINVGGMPGVESGDAFWLTCLGIVVMLGVELYIFRKLKWI